ncbi:lachrymatory-factor synthase [Iris pallida]|uniref:Lachrymatory-factor synthase n=1 Tax=Iris pallida TaxID=29817 RepID=A0AAX6GWW5_IRIPA|nr:lachrymatory-factor synthase [Iris pallida]KAJ6833270.1 lachrymatory-factor synthase [Iris pallida]
MEEKKPAERWEALVRSSPLHGVQPDQAWSLLGDFCGLQKFYPALTTSHLIDGVNGEPGCVRYCSTASLNNGTGHSVWVKERLLDVDAAGRSYTYDIVESNAGFGEYVATLRVVPVGGDGCGIEWSFEAEPVEGWTRSALVSYMEGAAEEVARMVGDALRAK